MRKVAIYGIGANFGGIDVSKNFLHSGVAGVGWDQADAPDLCVKGIGIVTDNASVGTFNIGSKYPINRGKQIDWLDKSTFVIPKPYGKNNVRSNSVYREFHPDVIKEILKRIP